MSNIEVTNSEKNKISIVAETNYYDENMEYDEKIVYFQLNMFNAFNNIYKVLKQLQREGHNVDEVMEEFISFYRLAKSQNSLRARRMYKILYDMLNDIRHNLCEEEAKEQLNEDIHIISTSLSGLTQVVMGDM